MIYFVVTEVDGDNIIRFDTQFGSHNGRYVNRLAGFRSKSANDTIRF